VLTPAFDHSRRLTGPSRLFPGPAVVLTPLGEAALHTHWHQRHAELVRGLCAELGWPLPQHVAQRHAQGTLLAFSAPPEALFTATEVNEWAWETCLTEAGATGFERLHGFGEHAAAHFVAQAAAELQPARAALRQAAQTHGVSCLEDDEALSLGGGSGSLCWPLTALPAVHEVPWRRLHEVPTLLVTGSNGKTTTVRLLAAIAQAAGLRPGMCTTEGVWLGSGFSHGEALAQGDYAGPAGARTVLRHAAVQAAVLETARGGILRRGLAVSRADVAVVTNVSADHFGEYGIDSLQDIAEVKLAVARVLRPGGALVLNGADEVLMAAAQRLPQAQALFPSGHALFAREFDHPRLIAHRALGAPTAGVSGGELLLQHQGRTVALGGVAALPLALGGVAAHNLENLAAAALAAACAGWPVAAIGQAVQAFGSRPQDNPGRLELRQHNGRTVLIDYAHNPDGLAELLAVARGLPGGAHAPLFLLLGQAGNRDDAALRALARVAAAAQPEQVVIKELPDMLRGRALGDVPAQLRAGLLAEGLAPVRLVQVDDEAQAAWALLHAAPPAALVVLPLHTHAARAQVCAWLDEQARPA
jgi:cyanophycin synthetase